MGSDLERSLGVLCVIAVVFPIVFILIKVTRSLINKDE